VLAGVALLVLFSSRRVRPHPPRHRKSADREFALTLLASTGIALPLASGYTTFDGLRNFTSAPLLSVAISFGVRA
jgi:hypothetical protein